MVKIIVVLAVLLTVAGYLVLVERKLLARLQVRFGPNRAGIFGVLQPLADVVKLLTKEDTIPSGADRIIFLFSPAVVAATTLLLFAVVPFGDTLQIGGKPIPLVITDFNVGLLYVLSLFSIGVYGVTLGGWASNSKYSLMGGFRGAAQMISYELPLGLSLVPVVMVAGSFSLVDIVNAQSRYPFLIILPVSFFLFLLGATAEIRRIPFDLPEAENELIAGYHTEYSGMRFALYFLGEYIGLVTLGSLVTVFFLGGWQGPFLPPIIWFSLKVLAVIFFMIWMRGTLPRLRYDQLMHLGWKVLIPISLVNIVIAGGVMMALKH